MQQEKPGQKSIADVEKLRYLILPTAKVYNLTIEKLPSDFYSSGKKNDYISLNIPLNISVFTGYFSQNRGSKNICFEE